jgi:hypothetical protein
MVMDNPFPISEYRDRLEAAVAELTKQSFEAHRSADERARLAAKAEGVALALSYWGEHEPAPAPAGGDHGQVTLNADRPFIVMGTDLGDEEHTTLDEALADAESRIDDCLDDTWSEDVDQILVARVTHRAVRTVVGRRADMTPEAWTTLTGGRTDVDEWWIYSIEPVDPADQADQVEGAAPVVKPGTASRSAALAAAQVAAETTGDDHPTAAEIVAAATATAPTTDPPPQVLVSCDWFNAWYLDGQLADEGKPSYLDAESVQRLYPHAAWYEMPQDVYDEILDGAGYPQALADLPLDRLRMIRAAS